MGPFLPAAPGAAPPSRRRHSARVRAPAAPRMSCDDAVRQDASRRDNSWTQSAKYCDEDLFKIMVVDIQRLNCRDIRALAMEADPPVAAWWAGIVLDEC